MRTIWWDVTANTVKMIDQRRLPLAFEIAEYDDYGAVAEAIATMVIRGAPAIGAAGGYGMALAARQSRPRRRGICWLIWKRPRRCSTRRGPPRSI